MKSYGIDQIDSNLSALEQHKENLLRKGISIENNLFTSSECDNFLEKVLKVYTTQELELGKNNLEKINEVNLARMPFLQDLELSGLFLNKKILEVVKSILGNVFEINLQNAVINKPNLEHHQSSWHRDLPYQNWVISTPIALNAFVCLTDFNSNNGATYFLPYSQKFTSFPSIDFAEAEKIQLNAPKGSVVFFDSMVYHKAGYNSSNQDRVGVNNMFTVPIIKSQVENDFSISNVELQNFSAEEQQILGLNFKTPKSVKELRTRKL